MRTPRPAKSVDITQVTPAEKHKRNVKNGLRTLRARINGREMTLSKNRNSFIYVAPFNGFLCSFVLSTYIISLSRAHHKDANS